LQDQKDGDQNLPADATLSWEWIFE